MANANIQKFRPTFGGTVNTLSDKELPLFLAYFYREDSSRIRNELRIRDRLIVLLMLDAGLRVGEVLALVVGDLHILGTPVGMINLRADITKTKTERNIPCTIRLHDAIQEMWLNVWQPSKFEPHVRAFLDATHGTCLRPLRVQRITKTAGMITIGRPVNPHMLRHTFATRLMRRCSIRIVQQLLGHASLSSTQVYTHPSTQDFQTAIDSLNT
jgi:site-specific recombinase XerC